MFSDPVWAVISLLYKTRISLSEVGVRLKKTDH